MTDRLIALCFRFTYCWVYGHSDNGWATGRCAHCGKDYQ